MCKILDKVSNKSTGGFLLWDTHQVGSLTHIFKDTHVAFMFQGREQELLKFFKGPWFRMP